MTRERTTVSTTAVLTVLLLASFWGLLEVSLGPWLRTVAVEWRAALLCGMGLGLAGIALGLYRRPLLLLLLPAGAIAIRMLAVPLLGVSPLCRLNNSIGIALEGSFLVALLLIGRKSFWRTSSRRMIAGGLAPLLAAGAFWYIGLMAEPCNYLLSYSTAGGLVKFLGVEGVRWALAATIMFPVGFAGGRVMAAPYQRWTGQRLLFAKSSIALLLAIVWTVSAVATLHL
jgi:hypothetical protein